MNRQAQGPHARLHLNLTILQAAVPGDQDLRQCVKEGMFEQPNRTGFERVLHYLMNAYDPKRVQEKIMWPIIDRRTDERRFRQGAVSLVNEIATENPEMALPTFSPSFWTSPGGDRFVKFMWKLSMLVLKVVLERSRDTDLLLLDRPTKGLELMFNITHRNLQEIRSDVQSLCALLSDASLYSKKLCKDILEVTDECKTAHSKLQELVQGISDSILSKNEKAVLLHSSDGAYHQVIDAWRLWSSKHVSDQQDHIRDLLKRSEAIKTCSDSVQALISSHQKPVKLEAPHSLEALQDRKGNLSLTKLLCEASKVTLELLSVVTAFNGLPSFEHCEPGLKTICQQLQDAETSFREVNEELLQLFSDVSNIQQCADNNGGALSNSIDRLDVGYKMIQEAVYATPPFILESRSELPHDLSISESPANLELGLIANPSRPAAKSRMLYAPHCSSDNSMFFTPQRKKKLPIPMSLRSNCKKLNNTSFITPSISRFDPSAISTVFKEPHRASFRGSFSGRPSSSSLRTSFLQPSEPLHGTGNHALKPTKKFSIRPMAGLDEQGRSEGLLNLAFETVKIRSTNEPKSRWLKLLNSDQVCSDNAERPMSDTSQHDNSISNGKNKQNFKLEHSFVTSGKLEDKEAIPKNSIATQSLMLSPSVMQETHMSSVLNGDNTPVKRKLEITSLERKTKNTVDRHSNINTCDSPNEFESPPCSPGVLFASFEESLTLQSPINDSQPPFHHDFADTILVKRDSCLSKTEGCCEVLKNGSSVKEDIQEIETTCKTTVSNTSITSGPTNTPKLSENRTSERRKSILAIVERYRLLTATMKVSQKVEPSEDLENDINSPLHSDVEIECDTNLDFGL